MYDIESRKKDILKRLNAKIKAERAFQGSISTVKESQSSRSLLGVGQPAFKGAKTGEQYIKDMRNRIPQDTKILLSSKKGSIEGYSSSQNSLTSDNRIKFDGRVRDFLAQKRSVDSTVVYKKPWVGGSDHGKSSKTDQARSGLSSLSSLNKPKQRILESHTGPPRLKSILKPQTRPISRRSIVSKTTTATSVTSKKSSRPVSDQESLSENLSLSDHSLDSEPESEAKSSESAESTRPSTSKSIFSWFSKKESPVKPSGPKASKIQSYKEIDQSIRIPEIAVKSAQRPVESADISTRSFETPIKTAKVSLKNNEDTTRIAKRVGKSSNTPIRLQANSTDGTTRAVKTPVRSPDRSERSSTLEKPIKSLQKSSKPVRTPSKQTQNHDPSDISRCQYCSRPFNADRLQKHESICIKTSQTRKTFDSSKKRLEGTDLSMASRSKSAPAKSRKKSEVPAKPNNWRKKHEELIESLRQAKAVSAHLAKGGKASDIPIVAAKNDGTPCPHCGRKFAEGSFERHVQICANLKHFGPRKS